MQYLRIKNWDQFQQYKDRDPKWIKLHRDLLYDYEFDQLGEIEQLHLVKIWLLAAKLQNKIPSDPAWLQRTIGAKSKVNVKQLVTAGFLVVYESVQECTEMYLEEEGEEEEEREEERAGTRKPQKRGQRLPTDWQPDKKLLAWAMKERSDLDLKRVIDSFTDYWQAKTGQAATKLDWDATFRNWVRNEKTRPRSSESTVQARERRNRAALGL